MICSFEEDEETQKKGAIIIGWMMDYIRLDEDADASFVREMSQSHFWLPMRLLNGIHLCIDKTPANQILSKMFVALTDRQLRPNFKVHLGTFTNFKTKCRALVSQP